MRLLGLLLAVGLAVGLTVYVMDRVNEQEQKAARDVAAQGLPGGVVAPPPGITPSAPRVDGAVDAATTAACATAAQALRGAEYTYKVLHGRYADLPTLVAAGVIRAPAQELYRIESTDGFVTYRLVGLAGCL